MLSGLVAKRVDVLGAAARSIAERATSVAVCPGYARMPLVEEQIADQVRVHGLPGAWRM
jgi:hypothetical protein